MRIGLTTKVFSTVLGYFMRGLLLVMPFALTIYIISFALNRIDKLIGTGFPGVGIAIIVVSITLLGYLGPNFLVKSLFDSVEGLIERVPLISTVYSSLKELTYAFVGKDKKFTKPVLVLLNQETQLQKIGFVTQYDLKDFNLPGSIAVYVPHSYNFSGDLFIVPKEAVKPLDTKSAEIMKFIVSGGVTGLATHEEPS